jgi:hypothetical protein
MPLLQKQDLEHRQGRIASRAPVRSVIGASKASNADQLNACSVRSRNPPPFAPLTIASTKEN